MKVCSVVGCGKKHDAKGYCPSHYNRYKRHGDPSGGSSTYDGESARWLLEHLNYDGDDCLIWPFGMASYGYGVIYIDGKMECVHTVIATIKYGPRPTDRHVARHLCGMGRKGCCSPNCLVWGTSYENQMDRVTHGTSSRGEHNGLSKLTRDDVLEIVKDKRIQHMIAADYNVTTQTICDIKKGRSWNWLTGIKP